MTRDIVLNSRGGQKGAYDDAKRVLSHLYEQGSSKGATLVEVDDKFIVYHEMKTLAVGIWTEDNTDVCIQVFPSSSQHSFQDPPGSLPRDLETPPVVFQVADRFFGEALAGCNYITSRVEWYDSRAGHRIKLVHAPSLFGMDLLMIRLIGLLKLPDWEVPVAKALRGLDAWVVEQWSDN